MFKQPLSSSPGASSPLPPQDNQGCAFTSVATIATVLIGIGALWYLNERDQAAKAEVQSREQGKHEAKSPLGKKPEPKKPAPKKAEPKKADPKKPEPQKPPVTPQRELQTDNRNKGLKAVDRQRQARFIKENLAPLTGASMRKIQEIRGRIKQKQPSITPAPTRPTRPTQPTPPKKETRNPNDWNYPARPTDVWLLAPHQAIALGNAQSNGKTVDIYPAASKAQSLSLSSEGTISSISFSPDSRYYATGDEQGNVHLYRARDENLIELVLHDSAVRALDFDDESEYFATGDDEGMTRVYNIDTRRNEHTMRQAGGVNALVLSRDGRYLAVTNTDRYTRIYDLGQKRMIRKIAHQAAGRSLSFSPDGEYLAIGSDHGKTQIYRLRQEAALATLPHRDAVLALAFSPDGQTLAAAAGEIVTIYHIPSERSLRSIRHSSTVIGLSFSDDGDTLLSATRTGLRKSDLTARD